MFYLFDQNNSGGSFVVNDKLCHRLFIEADSAEEAVSIAENLGCYWDGVDNGIDCPCCGDRWYRSCEEVNMDKYREEGYVVSVYDGIYKNTVAEWNRRYGGYEIIGKPHFETSKYSSSRSYIGTIKFNTVEEYAQYLAIEFGWTTPDARIFYKSGNVNEIFIPNT